MKPSYEYVIPSLLGYACDHCVELTSDSPSGVVIKKRLVTDRHLRVKILKLDMNV